jgi:hypothetical protein
MIVLDGNSYSVSQLAYSKNQIKLGSTGRSLQGKVLRNEAQVFQTEYDITLLLNITDIPKLRASFTKSYGIMPLDFTDEEGIEWIAASGSDDDSHFYGTGVYFVGFQEPKALSVAQGWMSGNRFTSQINLLTASYYGVRPRPSGYLLTEAGAYLNTESNERILWQASI